MAFPGRITLFLCGDVMTGRGIDQALPHPGEPTLYEPVTASAEGYVELAESAHGAVPRPVDFAYVWGDALGELERVAPDARIANLETAVTRSPDAWKGKYVHYRMSPDNAPVLAAAGLDIVSLANNHVLDWGRAGLDETLATLDRVGIRHAGAGRDTAEARAPAIVEVPGKGRVLVFAFGERDSGIPGAWAASADRSGIRLLDDLSPDTARTLRPHIDALRRPGDIVVASIHWGPNWGFDVPEAHVTFAHALIDDAGVDAVHGHSSHHVMAIEVHAGRPIFYGCGDLLNDYEGIRGYEDFRDDLGLLYLPSFDPATGRLERLRLSPTRIRRFRLEHPPDPDITWLADTLTREGERFGTSVAPAADGRLELHWS